MKAHALAEKFRRALRNGTGATFSYRDLLYMGQMGSLMLLAEAEARELCGDASEAHSPKLGMQGINAPDQTQGKSPRQPSEVGKPDDGRPFSPKSLAARWSCSAAKVRAMCHSGELASFAYGKLLRISAEEVARFEREGIRKSSEE